MAAYMDLTVVSVTDLGEGNFSLALRDEPGGMFPPCDVVVALGSSMNGFTFSFEGGSVSVLKGLPFMGRAYIVGGSLEEGRGRIRLRA